MHMKSLCCLLLEGSRLSNGGGGGGRTQYSTVMGSLSSHCFCSFSFSLVMVYYGVVWSIGLNPGSCSQIGKNYI